jgi:hypothetical protein
MNGTTSWLDGWLGDAVVGSRPAVAAASREDRSVRAVRGRYELLTEDLERLGRMIRSAAPGAAAGLIRQFQSRNEERMDLMRVYGVRR